MNVGSSPHARGLRFWSPRRSGATRIIPARAGFTTSPSTTSRRPRDHPRTRGVYPRDCTNSIPGEGSSPHARGLHGLVVGGHDRFRIIPARAGFTSPSCGRPSTPTDHPRTRGVYIIRPGGPQCDDGSSPHARGLHGRVVGGDAAVRIIPARAGFTRRALRVGRLLEDHPRTRGVYPEGDLYLKAAEGSSPHARGLLFPAGGSIRSRTGRRRIIPARAGFTGKYVGFYSRF